MIFKIFFWISNLCFLLIAYLGILPHLGSSLFPDFLAGELPFDIFLPFIGLIGVPTASTVARGISNFNKRSTKISDRKFDLSDPAIARELTEAEVSELKSLPDSEIQAFKLHDSGSPLPVNESRSTDWLVASISKSRTSNSKFSLAKLFFGIEAPLLLLCLMRLFWLHELTPASTLIFLTALVCIASYTYSWLRPEQSESGGMEWLQMAGHSLMLLMGLYLSVLCLFYAIPGIYLGGISLIYSIFFLPILPLAIAVVTLIIAPLGLAITYIQAWRGFYRKFAAKHGVLWARGIAIAVLSTWAIAFATTQIQPQNQIFALLNQPTGDPVKRQELLKKSGEIREGLLNAYLSRYRYPSISEEDTNIRDFYEFLRFPREFADRAQDIHNFLLSPFVYKGSSKDSVEAETLYAQFFDRPILRAEQTAIQQAVNATFDRVQAKAGLLSVNQKKVWLSQQEVAVKEYGDWADVEIHEVYVNRTSDRQEIFYAFSLPESAVLTGVWLGDTDKRSDSFPFQVSTRGAAQKVYNAEVQKRVDPALLEQVGPSSYRLRVFPILPQFARDAAGKEPVMHMWMAYKVLGKAKGWPLPQLAERRNVFWNQKTKRTFNGQNITSKEDAWFQPEAALTASKQIQPQLHEVNLSSGDRLTAKPLSKEDYRFPLGKRFAIVLDGSRSMGGKQTLTALNWLKEQIEKDNDLDLYLSASTGAKPQRMDNLAAFDRLPGGHFYGLLRPQEILQQFSQLQGDTRYDAIVMLTDEGNYELTDEKAVVPKLTAPLWLVHLGQGLPAAYDDATLEAIQSSDGGVATSVEEVMQRIGTQTALAPSIKNVVDGYAWSWEAGNSVANSSSLNPQSNQIPNTNEASFVPIAARQLVRELSQSGENKQLAELDAIHALAKRYNIVTPYSSMIVLVNDEQRQALKNAENQNDRFNRTVEDNQLPQPPSSNLGLSNVSGVPEPSEWLLMGIVTIALILIARRTSPSANH